MQFTTARPDAIRAINQRWLLKYWIQHLDGARVPRWQAVKTDDLASMADHLSFLDVIRGKPLRFVIRFHGRMVGRAYGTPDCSGRHLDEIIPVAGRDETLAPYVRAAKDGVPVYTIQDVTDTAERLIHFERLLLPFARNGETVDRILAAFEFVCADGDFDDKELLSASAAAPTLQLSAIIEARAMA